MKKKFLKATVTYFDLIFSDSIFKFSKAIVTYFDILWLYLPWPKVKLMGTPTMLVKIISWFNREYKYDIGLKDGGGGVGSNMNPKFLFRS
jgi:hypothetical protein